MKQQVIKNSNTYEVQNRLRSFCNRCQDIKNPEDRQLVVLIAETMVKEATTRNFFEPCQDRRPEVLDVLIVGTKKTSPVAFSRVFYTDSRCFYKSSGFTRTVMSKFFLKFIRVLICAFDLCIKKAVHVVLSCVFLMILY